MKSIEEKALHTYEKNMSYLLDSHPDIHKIVSSISSTTYALDYLEEYFDVKELHTNRYLYAGNSSNISKQLTDRINNSKSTSCFEGFPLYYITNQHRENINEMNNTIKGVLPIMEYYIDNVHHLNLETMKKIEKYIFIGVGLGMHIELTHEKLNAHQYFIIEDDIELFRLSLFTTDYAKISKNSNIYFSINDSENIFTNKFRVFLEHTFHLNRFLKYTHFPAHNTSKIKLIQNALSSNDFAVFGYNASLSKFIRPLEHINDGYNNLNVSKHLEDKLFFEKPVLLLASGPSLLKNIALVQKNQGKFIIIAVASSLKILYKHNIRPDIVTHIDGFNASYSLFEGFNAKEFLHDTIAIFGPFTPTNLKNNFQKQNIFFYEEGTSYFKDSGNLQGSCIGSLTLALSLLLNTKELFLLGLDLAFDQETGATHSKDHVTKTVVNLDNKESISQTMGLRVNIFPVPGNFTDTVYTSSLFYLSVQAIFNLINNYKTKEQHIYNLNDGAKLRLTIPTKIESLDFNNFKEINKKDLHFDIEKLLSSHSFKALSKEDEVSIKERLKHSKTIKKYLLKYKKNVKYSDTNKYLYNLLALELKIIERFDRESSNLASVYDSFFKYVLPIVFDFFNTEGIKNEKKHLRGMDIFIQNALFDIVNIYEGALESFIEKRL